MPRPNLHRAQALVRAFCLDNGMGYREDTLVGSYRQTFRSLGGRAVVAAPQPA
jgi:hypothetical protein